MGIEVLGPLRVDGNGTPLTPRDRVVLAALTLRPGEETSAERLADALWGEGPPASWNKVVQGCVSRLRKVLGAAEIETLAHGYRLTIPADQIDSHRFERLFRRGQELMTLGEPERAAHVFGEALALWRGRALVELDGWDTGEAESARLDELRLETEEARIDASLRGGRYRDVLADAQSLVAAAPLRERRWALLASAQYQAGRQAEALRTLRQARTVLMQELGLDPGAELVALEQAILQQDASLAPVPLPEPSTACPYRGLVPYGVDDADEFFGRDADIEACLRRLNEAGVLAVAGASGSGKSSLVRAGIAATLLRGGRRVVVVNPGTRPMDALTALPATGPAPVLVVDQCEEVVTLCDDVDEQDRFLTAVAAHAERAQVVLAIRADGIGPLSRSTAFARLVERGLYLLGAMDEDALRAAIERPAHGAGLLLEPGVVDLLVQDVRGEPGALPLLSHALRQSWELREGRTLTVDAYRATGGIRGAVAQSAEAVYSQVSPEQQGMLRNLLLRLVATMPDGELVRSRVPRRLVAVDDAHERLVELLVSARLVTSDEGDVALAHEALARAWPRLQDWLDEDIEGQRILRHLATTADAWDTMGRPDSELYRGTRLTRTLEWQADADPGLTEIEHEFVDRSRALATAEEHAEAQRARQQTRVNRRLRVLLVATSIALVIALVASVVAIQQSDRVSEQRDEAALRALSSDAISIRETQRDLAALLAVEASRLDTSAGGRSALLGTFTGDPGFVGYIHGVDAGANFAAGVARPDGATAYISDASAVLHVVDLVAGKDTGQRLPEPAVDDVFFSRLSQSADGSVVAQIVAGSAQGGFPLSPIEAPAGNDWLIVYDGDAMEMRYPPIALDFNVGDIAVSPDGQWMVAAGGRPSEAVVFRADTGTEAGRIAELDSIPTGARFNTAAVVFDTNGLLYLSSEAGPVRIIDPASRTEVGRLPGPPGVAGARDRLAITADASTLVGVSDAGTMVAWDVPARSVRWVRRPAATGTSIDETCDSLAVDRAGKVAFCGNVAGVVQEFDLTNGAPTGRRLDFQHGGVADLLVTADGSTLVEVGSARPVIGQWRLNGTGPITRTIAADRVPVGYNADGTLLLVRTDPGGAGSMDVWDPEHDRVVDPLDDMVDGLWSPASDQVTGIFTDGASGRRDITTGARICPCRVLDAAPAAAWAGRDHVLVLYQTGARVLYGDGGVETSFTLPSGGVADAAFSPDGSQLSISGGDGTTVFDTATGAVLAGPDGSELAQLAIGGHMLVHGTHTGVLTFRDPTTLATLGPALPAANGILDLAIAADASAFITFGGDRVVRIFDGKERVQLGDGISVPRDDVRALLRPDGRALAVATAGGIALWDLDAERWVEAACTVAGRNLTRAEWDTYIGDLAPYRATCPAYATTAS